jgi:hypothetical protein
MTPAERDKAEAALRAAGLAVARAPEQLAAEARRLAPLVQDGLLPAWRVTRELAGIAVANSRGSLGWREAKRIVEREIRTGQALARLSGWNGHGECPAMGVHGCRWGCPHWVDETCRHTPARAEWAERVDSDPWIGQVGAWLEQRGAGGVTTTEALAAIGAELSREAETRMGALLRELGLEPRQRREEGERVRRYFAGPEARA